MECPFDNECYECDFCNDELGICTLLKENNPMPNEKTNPLENSELAKAIRGKMSAILCVDDEDLDKIVNDSVKRIADKCESILIDTVNKAVTLEWGKYIEKLTDQRISDLMKESLEAQIFKDTEKDIVLTTCQKIIQSRVIRFFQNNWEARENRNKVIEGNMEAVISHTVNEKVNDAITEIKKECIEKFQKAAMKKMMEGMAQAINQDKRLLELMTNPNL